MYNFIITIHYLMNQVRFNNFHFIIIVFSLIPYFHFVNFQIKFENIIFLFIIFIFQMIIFQNHLRDYYNFISVILFNHLD